VASAVKDLLNKSLSVAKTPGVLSFTPLTMLRPSAQAVDFKVGRHFSDGQVPSSNASQHLRRRMCISQKYREHSEQSFFASLEQASVAQRMR
jgi:hypothetical protein